MEMSCKPILSVSVSDSVTTPWNLTIWSIIILKSHATFQVRKQLEELLSRNGGLSRTNTELRHKITEVDYKNKELKDRILSQKSQIEHLTKVKKKQEETMDNFEVRTDFFICQ